MTSVARRHDDSGEFSDGSQDIEHNHSGNEGGQGESDYDSQGSDSDRSDRDPESQETERRVDDDEDRSNPQYIPKRGTFYEHDDRTAASGEESTNTASELSVDKKDKKEGSETGSERRRAPRKSDVINKWSHDKFNENEQMPKSRDELVAVYGYDIRNEDTPPHARRNRRYGRYRECETGTYDGRTALKILILLPEGAETIVDRDIDYARGPNKYTRTWEDEEAYKRQTAAAAQPRKPPNPEDFPHLDAANNRNNRKPRTPRPRSKSQPNNSNESLGPSENGSLRRNPSLKTAKKPVVKQHVAMKPVAAKTPVKPVVKKDEGREKKMPAIENLTITTNVGNSQGQPQRKVNVGVGQQRPVPTEQAKKKPQPVLQPQPQINPPQSKPPPQQQPQPQQKQQQQQQSSQQQQPAGAEPRGGSKRYSSLRQRPLADNYVPQQPQKNQQQPPLQQQQAQLQQQQSQLQQQQQSQLQQQQQSQLQQQQQSQLQQQQQIRYNAGNVAEFTPQVAPAPNSQLQQQLLHQQVHRNATASQHAPSPPHQLPTQQHPTQQLPVQQLATQPHPTQQHSQQQRLLLEQQQLVAHHSLHNLPPQPHALPPHGQLQPTQGYAPPAMMPAQYMQSGTGPVFSGPAIYAAPAAPYNHPQMYTPHHNFATQAGGVTYFSCAEQEPPAPAARPARRPTAAIPIVKPAHHDRAPNSTEKDNIDRIVENMFVRKPWPATHGADSKEKSQSERSSQEPSTKESQPNSLTSSSISTDSKPSESRDPEETPEEKKEESNPQPPTQAPSQPSQVVQAVQAVQASQESISTDA